jgi:hypothetical protein
MAYEVNIAATPARAKVRNPWGVLGLSVVTLGIYHIFWWYFVNRELRDLGRARGVTGLGDNPALSCLAAWLGGFTLYIATIWTYVAGTKRAQRAQLLVGQPQELNGWIMLALAIFTIGIGCPVYFQAQLNKVWQSMGHALPTVGSSGMLTVTTDLDRIEKLAELRDSGAITSDEFETEKAKILPRG